MPTVDDRDDVLSFYRECGLAGDACIGHAGYEEYDSWLLGMQNRHTGQDLPEGYVQEDFYLCFDGDRLVGVFSLKFELTDYLLNFGGHVGYAVRPSVRNRGLATRILRQGLEKARQLGLSRVLCVCDEDNIASERVILNNGGVFENELFDPEENVAVKRYWISL